MKYCIMEESASLNLMLMSSLTVTCHKKDCKEMFPQSLFIDDIETLWI